MTDALSTRMRVLLIDDQPIVGEAVQRALADAPDLELHYCRNSTEAMSQVAQVQPMVVLLDLIMPAPDGFDVLVQLRNEPALAGLPIIMLSTNDDANTKSRAFALGANDYIVKVPDKVEFIARLRYHCRAFLNQQQLRRTNQQLEAATTAKSTFLAHMSHEIRTPMNGVIAMTELLSETGLDAEQRSYVDVLQRSSESLLEIINDVLDFSKIEAGKMHLDIAEFDLRRLLDDVQQMMQPRAAAKGLKLLFMIDEAVPRHAGGDAGRLRQILTNLVGNALKFTHEGRIVVRVQRDLLESAAAERQRFYFEVIDTGIGLTSEQQSGLFQAFSQADASTTRKYGGTGLGLAISKYFVELMNGQIGVESEFQRGSTFWFTAEFSVSVAERKAENSVRQDLDGVRLLLVQEQDAEVAGWLLAQTLSWGVMCNCRTADEAIEELAASVDEGRPYELLLLDLEGAAAIRFAKGLSAALQSLPKMVLLTPASAPVDSRYCREGGITATLAKPVQPELLFACLMNALHPQHKVDPSEQTPQRKPAKSLHLLVVDDNEVNQISAVRMLKKLGIDADVATDGVRAVEACRTARYDMVLMDCAMPNMDGFAATRQIRAEEQQSGGRRVPIIALTANVVRGQREKCLAAGMDDYMSKPIRFAQLKEMIAHWSDRNLVEPETPAQTAAVKKDNWMDFDALDKIREIDGELLAQLCTAFAQEGGRDLARLRVACESHDAPAVGQLAHRLRGSCVTLGVNGLAGIFDEMENAAGSANFDRCAVLLPQAERGFERAVGEFRLQPDTKL